MMAPHSECTAFEKKLTSVATFSISNTLNILISGHEDIIDEVVKENKCSSDEYFDETFLKELHNRSNDLLSIVNIAYICDNL